MLEFTIIECNLIPALLHMLAEIAAYTDRLVSCLALMHSANILASFPGCGLGMSLQIPFW